MCVKERERERGAGGGGGGGDVCVCSHTVCSNVNLNTLSCAFDDIDSCSYRVGGGGAFFCIIIGRSMFNNCTCPP